MVLWDVTAASTHFSGLQAPLLHARHIQWPEEFSQQTSATFNSSSVVFRLKSKSCLPFSSPLASGLTAPGNLLSRDLSAQPCLPATLSPLVVNTELQVLGAHTRQVKGIKGVQIGKEEIKLSLFTDNTTAYPEDPREPTKYL